MIMLILSIPMIITILSTLDINIVTESGILNMTLIQQVLPQNNGQQLIVVLQKIVFLQTM